METCSALHLQHLKCLPKRLENIEEDESHSGLISISAMRPPDTPTETMEFLARSWSLSASELSQALGNILPPPSQPADLQSLKFLRGAPRAKTMAGWMRDHKERRRTEARTRAAQIYAATSVAGVAAVVAATAAGSVFAPHHSLPAASEADGACSCRTGAAIASAAALVASHCVEMAQAIGATRDQILAVIRSAVNARTTGDIMALTASAATALRAAALLSARQHRDISGAVMRGEGSSAQSFVSRGGELLKRTRKGDLHWKQVSVYMNSNCQVVVKMKSTHMGGTFVKKKKGAVVEVCPDIPAWPGREGQDGSSSKKAYFGIRTNERLIEFECKALCDQKLWVDGIQQTLQFRANLHTAMSM